MTRKKIIYGDFADLEKSTMGTFEEFNGDFAQIAVSYTSDPKVRRALLCMAQMLEFVISKGVVSIRRLAKEGHCYIEDITDNM